MGMYQFNPDDAFRFARERNARTKQNGNELQLMECPYCHGGGKDKYTFSINLQTGAFNCMRASCGAKGNMITLSGDFGFSLGNQVDAYYRHGNRQYRTLPQRKPEPKDAALAYLAGRGISEDIARQYNLTTSNNDENVLCFPFYDEAGLMCFIKYRNMSFKAGDPGNKEWCQANCKPILFGMNHCDPAAGPLVLTEGQIDSLSVAECGIPNAVSVPNGKNGFTWIPYCWDFLQKFPEIIVFGDCERGEITLLDEMSRRFRNSKTVRHVRIIDYLGHKDANEIMQKEGKDAVIAAVKQAEAVPNPRIQRVADIKRMDMQAMGGIKVGFSEVDKKLEKLFFGQLVLLTGERGHGKSTLAMQLGARAVNAGIPTMFYSGELPGWMFKDWIERQFAGKRHINTIEHDGWSKALVDASVLPAMEEWYQDKLYLYDIQDVDDEGEPLLKTLETAVVQYGCKMVVVDNLMTAMDDDAGSDLNRQQTAFVKQLARMAKEHNILVLLIAHPKKVADKDKGFDNDDVSGSSNITNLCDVVLRYAKPRNASKDTMERVLCITKNRNNGRVDYDGVRLYFEEESKRISAIDGMFGDVYGWDASPEPMLPKIPGYDNEDIDFD